MTTKKILVALYPIYTKKVKVGLITIFTKRVDISLKKIISKKIIVEASAKKRFTKQISVSLSIQEQRIRYSKVIFKSISSKRISVELQTKKRVVKKTSVSLELLNRKKISVVLAAKRLFSKKISVSAYSSDFKVLNISSVSPNITLPLRNMSIEAYNIWFSEELSLPGVVLSFKTNYTLYFLLKEALNVLEEVCLEISESKHYFILSDVQLIGKEVSVSCVSSAWKLKFNKYRIKRDITNIKTIEDLTNGDLITSENFLVDMSSIDEEISSADLADRLVSGIGLNTRVSDDGRRLELFNIYSFDSETGVISDSFLESFEVSAQTARGEAFGSIEILDPEEAAEDSSIPLVVEIEDTTEWNEKILKIYTSAEIKSVRSTASGVYLRHLEETEEEQIEQIEFVDGKGSVSKPIKTIKEHSWLDTNLGGIEEEDGVIISENKAESLCKIKYLSPVYKYLIRVEENKEFQLVVEYVQRNTCCVYNKTR